MTFLAAALAVVVFVSALDGFGLPRVAAKVMGISRTAFGSLRDLNLSDDEKERTLQRASLSLMKLFFSIGLRSAGALGAALLPPLLFDVLGLADMWDVSRWLARWEGILGASLFATIWYLLRRPR